MTPCDSGSLEETDLRRSISMYRGTVLEGDDGRSASRGHIHASRFLEQNYVVQTGNVTNMFPTKSVSSNQRHATSFLNTRGMSLNPSSCQHHITVAFPQNAMDSQYFSMIFHVIAWPGVDVTVG